MTNNSNIVASIRDGQKLKFSSFFSLKNAFFFMGFKNGENIKLLRRIPYVWRLKIQEIVRVCSCCTFIRTLSSVPCLVKIAAKNCQLINVLKQSLEKGIESATTRKKGKKFTCLSKLSLMTGFTSGR